jgi:hypothetical protein
VVPFCIIPVVVRTKISIIHYRIISWFLTVERCIQLRPMNLLKASQSSEMEKLNLILLIVDCSSCLSLGLDGCQSWVSAAPFVHALVYLLCMGKL